MRIAYRYIIGVCALATILGSSPRPPPLVVLYDPDANHQAIVSISAQFQSYLRKDGSRVTFQAVQDGATFERLLKRPDVAVAIVSSRYLESRRGGGLTPRLVPSFRGVTTFSKELVTASARGKDLSGQSVAAALGSGNVNAASKRLLANLRTAGFVTRDTIVVPVSKDIDALLAVSFKQVEAAVVTPDSRAVLERINPGAAKSLTSLWRSEPISRSPACVVSGRVSAAAPILDKLRAMASDPGGRRAMNVMGFDAWVEHGAGTP